ncbi:MAG: acyl-CoA dehydrogenase family protein, partial [Candidatus Hydrogenedentota bacterium]
MSFKAESAVESTQSQGLQVADTVLCEIDLHDFATDLLRQPRHEEIRIAESIKEFVDKEVMPRRQDLDGGWHKNEELAVKTLDELYSKLHKQLEVTKANLPSEYGGLGLAGPVRQMINEEISRGDIGLSTMVGKIHWVISFMLA